MSAAIEEIERDLVAELVADMRSSIDEAAAKSRKVGGPHIEIAIQFQYSLLGLIESAIAEGLSAPLALLFLRDAGLALWGVRRMHQHGGIPCTTCIETDLRSIDSVYLNAAGGHADVKSSRPASLHPHGITTRH